MAAGAGIPAEDERPASVAAAPGEVAPVELPQRVEPGAPRVPALLPVEPPEVDPVLLHRPQDVLEQRIEVCRVGHVERHRRLGLGIDSESGGHCGIGGFVSADAVGGVVVEGDPQATTVQLGEEGRRVGEESPLPGVAGPPGAEPRVDVGDVPVHVEHRDRQGDPLGSESVQQREVFVGGVGVVAAPPGAEHPAWHERHRPGEGVVVGEGGPVVATMGEDVEVDLGAVPVVQLSVGVDDEGVRVVEDGDAVAGADARLERDPPVGLVEGAGGAAEGAQRLAVAPGRAVVADPATGGHRQAHRRGWPSVPAQLEPVGADLDTLADPGHLSLDRPQVTPDDHLGGPILEAAGRGILDAHQVRREHRDPPTIPDHARHDARR